MRTKTVNSKTRSRKAPYHVVIIEDGLDTPLCQAANLYQHLWNPKGLRCGGRGKAHHEADLAKANRLNDLCRGELAGTFEVRLGSCPTFTGSQEDWSE